MNKIYIGNYPVLNIEVKMNNDQFRKILTPIILATLIVLTFLLIKPLLISIIIGVMLAFLFIPLYEFCLKFLKSKNFTALLMTLVLVILILIPLWYITPILVDQSIKFYMASQQMDFVTPLKSIFPSIFQSEQFSSEIGSALHSFVTGLTNSVMNAFSRMILNFPTLFLQFLVVLFIFFFVLKDRDQLLKYLGSLSPFTRETEKKLFKSSKDITLSVLYGQILLGILQGLICGIAFFAFGVPNALFLTLLACLAGIFPIVGTTIVWIPVTIYLFIAGNALPAIGVISFGIISSIIENLLKPIFISKRTEMNSSLILIGMVGGLFMFGILGVILGPLILAYLFIVLEIYRNKKLPGVFIEQSEQKSS